MNEILEKVRKLTEIDLQHKALVDLVLSAAEELGEFAREVKIEDGVFGNSHKEAGPDGSVGEAVDMVIIALALYYARSPKTGQATLELPERILAKLNKWESNQREDC